MTSAKHIATVVTMAVVVCGCVHRRSHSPTPVRDAIVEAAGKALDQIPPPGVPLSPLQVDPPVVTFAPLTSSGRGARPITIANAGATSVILTSLAIEGRFFRVDFASLPVTLEPGQRHPAVVYFEPAAPCRCTGTLVIKTEKSGEFRVPLTGRAD